MGNSLQLGSYMDCFHQCFGRHHKRWLMSTEIDHDFSQGAPLGTARRLYERHRRISEYLSWALRRSRAPLLLDDVLANEVNARDFGGVNSTSWISDTAGSDASHALYREMDPYSYPPMDDSLSFSSCSSVAEGLDRYKTGGGSWVAVTKLTGPSSQTATSLVFVPNADNDPLSAGPYTVTVEEELDGLELARNLRSRCSGPSTYHGCHGNKVTTRQPVSSIPSKPTPIQLGVPHSTPLKPGLSDPTSLHPHIHARVTPEVPVDLAWDHEPGTVSPQVTEPTVRKPHFPYPTLPEVEHSPQPDVCLHQKLYPARPRRRGRKVALLPVSGDEDEAGQLLSKASTNKRWSYSDNSATPNATSTPVAAWLSSHPPHPNGMDAVGQMGTAKAPRPTDELFDSGFVGLGNSVAGEDEDEDDATDRRSQTSESLLWENELYTASR